MHDVIFFQHRQFKIPFKNDQKNGNITQVRLYVSRDQGRSWNLISGCHGRRPRNRVFASTAAQDSLFLVRRPDLVDSREELISGARLMILGRS